LGKANAFSDYLSQIYTVEIIDNFDALPEIRQPNSMPNITFNDSEVLHQLSNLKISKSPGPDMLHPRVLYELRYELVKPLTELFNESMNKGLIPDE